MLFELKPMKHTSLALIWLTSIMGAACSEKNDPAPVPQTVLTLSVDAQFVTSDTEDWLVVHNPNGELIDYKPFESGDSFTFETTAKLTEDKINVTTIKRRLANGYDAFSVTSHMQVDKGQTLVLRGHESTQPGFGNQIGEFGLELSNVSDGYAIALTDKFGFSGNSGWSGGTNLYTATTRIHETARDFLLFAADGPGGNIKHKWFREVEGLDLYKLSMNDLEPFDRVVEVSFPLTDKIQYHVSGSRTAEQTENFYECSNILSGNLYFRTSLKLGYLDDFQKHSTWFQISHGDRTYYYAKNGAAPSSITLPLNAVFTTSNTSITDFTYTKSQSFSMRRSSWVFRDTETSPQMLINWEVFSPEGAQLFTEWPAELTTKYPALAFDKMQYISTNFYTESPSYQDQINFVFKGVPTPDVASIGVIVK